MTDRILTCNNCGIHLAVIRDGKIRKGMVCYCRECDTMRGMLNKNKPAEMPEFFKDIFKEY